MAINQKRIPSLFQHPGLVHGQSHLILLNPYTFKKKCSHIKSCVFVPSSAWISGDDVPLLHSKARCEDQDPIPANLRSKPTAQ